MHIEREGVVTLPQVRRRVCLRHWWLGSGECPKCVRQWAEVLAGYTVPQDTAYDHQFREDSTP